MLSLNQTDDSKILIGEEFIVSPHFYNNGQEYIKQITGIRNLSCLNTFSDITEGETDINKLGRYFRLSLDGTNFTDWFSLEETKYNVDYNTLTFYEEIGSVKIESETPIKMYKFSGVDFSQIDNQLTYILEVKWIKDSLSPNKIVLKSFSIEGTWYRETTNNPLNNFGNTSDYLYLRPGELLKVFKLNGILVDADGITTNRKLDIEYRFSQDSGRTWSNWEKLNDINISSLKYSRIKFFLPEYRIRRTGDLSGVIYLYDIQLLGDVQNVSKDYLKTNKLGIRECCCIYDVNGNELEKIVNNIDITGTGAYPGSNPGSGNQSNQLKGLDNCTLPDIFKTPLANENLENLFKPYDLSKAVDLYSGLANISTEMFGFNVTYFSTDTDLNGQDHSFHEFQLYNVSCAFDIKVTVDENNFPDNQIVFNQFDLGLFESFEIQITKDVFHRAFGISRRPSKEDFLWFCELNRMYQVEHAQVKRDFNNAGVYYRVILKKYVQKANVKAVSSSIEDRISALTRNSTLDELMGIEKANDKLSIANKEQHRTLTHDRVRDKVYVSVVNEFIDNSTLIVSKSHYDLNSITYSYPAIVYNSDDKTLNKSDNRSFSIWFNVNDFYEPVKEFIVTSVTVSEGTYSYSATHSVTSYTYVTQSINLIDNYSSNYGYKISLNNTNTFDVTLNDLSFSMTASVTSSVWYCYLVNIDQRNLKVDQYLYKRNVTNEDDAIKLRSSKLLLLATSSNTISENQEFEIDYDMNILASNSKITNIRIFNDIVLPDVHDKVLNQNIVRDSQYLILADNSNKVMKAKNFPYN